VKIEIDLSDIFCDSEDPCDLQEAIREEVVRSLTKKMGEGLTLAIQRETTAVINAELCKAVQERMPSLVVALLDDPFVPVDRYGTRGEPTTFRGALVKEINSQMVYKKTQYDSDKNAFSRAIDDVLKQNLDVFKAEMKKQVDQQYTAAVLQEAVSAIRLRIGIK
jgi:hypothetical protein